MFLKNNSARVITVNGVMIPVKGVASVEADETHKGVAMAVKKGWVEKTTEKEYKAYSDPEGLKAELEKAAADEAEKNTKKDGK